MHAGERAASGAYADAQELQHGVSSIGAAGINPRGVGDSGKVRSARVLLACAGERALHTGEREACTSARNLQHALQSSKFKVHLLTGELNPFQ